ncbi:MAG: sensor histidine kinase [Bacteriovoracaceae bacterium]
MQSLDLNATFKILKNMEGSLQHGEFVFNRTPGIACIISETGDFLRGNDHLASLLECNRELIITRSFCELLEEKDWGIFEKSFKKLTRFPEINFITSLKGRTKKDLPVKFSWTISFLKRFEDRNMNTYLIIGADVTDMFHYQVLLEKQVKERTKELEVALEDLKNMQGHMVSNARMASLGEMAGNVAHEINNPLNIINLSLRSVTKNLKKEGVEIEKVDKQIDKISNMVKRMGEIIQSLKGFSRDSSNDPMQAYSIEDIIDGSLLVIQEKIEDDGIKLIVEYNNTKELKLFCNKTALNQVIVNLLTNAYDYTKPIEGEKVITIDVKDTEETVDFSITDSGPGIDEENRLKIWEPFFTTKELGAGTGLGLSMSKGIVEKQHRGTLELAPGAPTTFIIKIPKNLEDTGSGGAPEEFFES